MHSAYGAAAWILLLAGLLGGCAVQSSEIGDPPPSSEPRPYVMQYAAVYYGGPDNSSFDWLELRRDGTFQVMVDGALHEGRYEERDASGREPALSFSGDSEEFVGALHANWVSGHQLTVSRAGIDVVLSTTSVGGEAMCEASGGLWRDDDADGAGLYCTCTGGRKYIPSAGGCTD